MNGPLDPYRRSKYSQHGEDGIIAFLCERLGITDGHCFEFGAADGTRFSNTLALIERGWTALYAEPDPVFRKPLERLAEHWPTLMVLFAWIEYGTGNFAKVPIVPIRTALELAEFPEDFAVISIDAEELSWPIWRALSWPPRGAAQKTRRPRIVVIEANSSHISYMQAMVQLGREMEYTCLGHCGNLVFVRDEDVERVGVPVLPAEELYSTDEAAW